MRGDELEIWATIISGPILAGRPVIHDSSENDGTVSLEISIGEFSVAEIIPVDSVYTRHDVQIALIDNLHCLRIWLLLVFTFELFYYEHFHHHRPVVRREWKCGIRDQISTRPYYNDPINSVTVFGFQEE